MVMLKRGQINGLEQVAHIWHCLMLGIVCLENLHLEQVLPHLLLPTIPSLDHLARGEGCW